MAKFEQLGLPSTFLDSAKEELEGEALGVADKIAQEPDEEALICNLIKTQSKDQKAQQSYESNMDVQGFGETITSGFFQTSTSGFGHSASRPQSAFMRNASMNALAKPDDPAMTEAGEDDEAERRAQEEFEQSMRATSMSFFKTVQSTLMSSNGDAQSKTNLTESQGYFQAWTVGQSAQKADRDDFKSDNASDLVANTD